MESVEVVLAMLLAVVASGWVGRILPFAVPLPLIQIGLGAVIAGVFGHGVALDPDFFFLLFLPPLLFLDGWRIPKVGLFRDKGVIIELALGLVLFTVVGAGFLMHWLIPALPLPVAFALAAIVAPTDPVAVSAITSRIPVPPRLMHILEGESLLNDATGLVCFRFAVAAATTGTFSLAKAGLTFVWVALAGIAAGVAVTFAITYTHGFLARRFGEDEGMPILINLLTPFGAYLVAEHLHASGILAAVAAGITMSYVELGGSASPSTRIRRNVIWDTLQFALNGVMFVLLGEQLPDIVHGALHPPGGGPATDPWWLAGNALALSLGLVLLRFTWVWVSLRLTILNQRRLGQQVFKPRKRLIFATSFAGVRGALTMAGVMTLPLTMPDGSPFPGRQLAILLASAVIVVSLLLASVMLPRLLRGLEVPLAPPPSMPRSRRSNRPAVNTPPMTMPSCTPTPAVRSSTCTATGCATSSWTMATAATTSTRRAVPNATTGWPPCAPSATPSCAWAAAARSRTRPRASCCVRSIWWKRATADTGSATAHFLRNRREARGFPFRYSMSSICLLSYTRGKLILTSSLRLSQVPAPSFSRYVGRLPGAPATNLVPLPLT
jgi:CPA1 family monovalent cation:H+ antiporter